MAHLLKEKEIIQIFSKIITYITDENSIGKDIFVSCIKEILKKMQADSCYTVGKTIIPTLTKGIQHKNITIKELCFDTFNDYINTFNYVLMKENDSVIKEKKLIFNCALQAISIDNITLRKVCSNFLGNMALIVKKDGLKEIMNLLIEEISKNNSTIQVKIAYINALSSVIKNTTSKQVDHIGQVYKILSSYCNLSYLESHNSSTEEYDHSNELVESCLGIFEVYVLKLPKIMIVKAQELIDALVELIKYDPNYNGDVKQCRNR